VLASLFVWVGAQHLRTDVTHNTAPPVEVAAALDTPQPSDSPRLERSSASLSLDTPSRDPLVVVLRRVCALIDRVPPVLRSGVGSEVCR
jgi:hypothetical protein